MRHLPLLLALVACTKAPPPAPVDIESQLHGTRPEQPVPLLDSFTVTAHDGTPRGPAALRGQPTVVWFFPAAATGGCTVEGCGYRDRYEQFQALGVEVVGVSFTDVAVNREWAVDQGFPYEIWRDDDRALATYYDAAKEGSDYPLRRTRILDASGAVVLEYNDKVVVGAHPEEVLEDVRLLFPPPTRGR